MSSPRAERLARAGEVGCPLRQMPAEVGECHARTLAGSRQVRRDQRGRQPRQPDRDFPRVPHRPEDRHDPRVPDARVEILEVELHEEPLTDVRLGVRQDRPARDEAVGRRMGGDPVEDLTQDFPLDLAETGLGGLDQPVAAALLAGPVEVAMRLARRLRAVAVAETVREPGDVPERDLEPVGDIAGGRHPRHAELFEARGVSSLREVEECAAERREREQVGGFATPTFFRTRGDVLRRSGIL